MSYKSDKSDKSNTSDTSTNITVYIKVMSGDIIPISFEPKDRNIHLIFKVQSFFPEYPVERILLYHKNFIDISDIKDGDILSLFICDSYSENWSSIYIDNNNYKTHIINWYKPDSNNVYFYNKEKTSICLYIDKYVDKDEEKYKLSVDPYNKPISSIWFSDMHQALLNFQKIYNSIMKHSLFTDDILIHCYHLWNLNTSDFYKEIKRTRYYDSYK